jgi:hypothetical protein
MLILSLVVLTGVVGAGLQHYMPVMMTKHVESETIYYQTQRVLGQLSEEADDLLRSVFRRDTPYGLLVPMAEGTTVVAAEEYTGNHLKQAYENNIKSYLAQRGSYRHRLNKVREARAFFADVRKKAPPAVHPAIDALESLCDEKRDLDQWTRRHRVLHAWLLVHAPLAFALIILGAFHAVMALRHSW